jgi:hypothetical protein
VAAHFGIPTRLFLNAWQALSRASLGPDVAESMSPFSNAATTEKDIRMDDFWRHVVEDMTARVSGPMKSRLILQPLMAVIFAVRAGLADAKRGRPPYFWALVTDPTHRREMLKDGWKSVGTVFVVALLLDIVYQVMVERFVYPGVAIIIALLLAIVPLSAYPRTGHTDCAIEGWNGRAPRTWIVAIGAHDGVDGASLRQVLERCREPARTPFD